MSIMQVCWSLMRYPRSKGIPYIMENGTFDQALVFMLRLFGIMLGLSVLENVIIFFITPVIMLDTIISILGFVFAWIFLKGLWFILVHFYVKATSNRNLTFKETFMAVSYAMAFDLPITVLSLLGAVLVVILSLAGAGMIAFSVQFILGLITFVLALYYILCSLGLYRQMLKTTSMHIIIIAIVYTVLLISASMMLRV
ncbi:hypothetical protein [Veillonella atypica]|uniref:Yip1 domain-containing protein n=1 Tax=Veillonella atypica TaxID=39777 RepID=A0A3A6WE60_9FIRM|nr:hypothetical protein [Veillonella atypica]RJY51388.1 hypothetical protein D2965_00475 [Veillonella atypica]